MHSPISYPVTIPPHKAEHAANTAIIRDRLTNLTRRVIPCLDIKAGRLL